MVKNFLLDDYLGVTFRVNEKTLRCAPAYVMLLSHYKHAIFLNVYILKLLQPKALYSIQKLTGFREDK